ncbi:MAG: LTA synthase family protein, partial [Chitinophagaceae bacterium]
ITIADPELYKQWGNKFNNQVLVYISHPKEMAISSGAVKWGKTILFALVLGFCFYCIGIILYRILRKKRQFSIQYTIADVVLTGVAFIMLRGGVGVATISQSSAIYSDKPIENAAAINSFWNALYYIFNDTESIYGDHYKVASDVVVKQSLNAQLKPDSVMFDLSDQSDFNVMIVMLESFTASGSQYFSGYNNCMPNLDKIARENLSFMQCYASGDRTEKGLVSVLSGYPAQPSSSIIVFPDKMAKLDGIGKVLKDKHYNNSFYYGGDAEFASMKAYLLLQGIYNIVDRKSFLKQELNSKWGAHDGNLYEKVLQDHRKKSEPFFTTILSLSSHEPFDVPHQSADLPRDEWYGYKNSLRYADLALYQFLKACEKEAWYDNTLIVLVADHGHDIGLSDKAYFGKEKYHIPMIVCGGALKPDLRGVKIQNVVSQTIIPSMILDAMGVRYSGFKWQTGISNVSGFAQYHYNNGFGRVDNDQEAIFDNTCKSFIYKGDIKDSAAIKRDGLYFQQYLIDDFMEK